MNMVPKNKYTHVRRASAGFTLLNGLVLILSIVALSFALDIFTPERSTDIVSTTEEVRWQGEVRFLFPESKGHAVIAMDPEAPVSSSINDVWAECWKLEKVDGERKWVKYGKRIPINIVGNLNPGEEAELAYTYLKKKTRSGEILEEMQRAEVHPPENTAVALDLPVKDKK